MEPDEGLSRPFDHSPGLSRPGTHDQSFRTLDDEQAAFMPLHPDEGFRPLDHAQDTLFLHLSRVSPRYRQWSGHCAVENKQGGHMAGSDKRRRDSQIKFRCTSEEFAAVSGKANKAGMSLAAFARTSTLGEAGPRSRPRVPVDAKALRQVLGHLGKIGSNLNQIARYLHTGGDPQTVLPDIRDALIDQAQLRRLIYEALGKTPDNAPPVDPQPPAAASKFIPPRSKK